MRRMKLYQLLAVAGSLGVAVAVTPVLADNNGNNGNNNNPNSSNDSGNGLGHDPVTICHNVKHNPVIITIDDDGLGGSFKDKVDGHGLLETDVGPVYPPRVNGDGHEGDFIIRSEADREACLAGPMTCGDLTFNDAQMGLIEKFEWSGSGYTRVSGTESVEIADTSTSTSVEWRIIKSKLIPDVDAVIINGLIYKNYNQPRDGARTSGEFDVLGGISTIEFCEDGHFDSKDAEVCLWTADQDQDGSYINIEQVGCVDAEKHKFYAIEADGEFSSVLEAE